jgi:TolB-like protein/DNA-binding winged helix-turn-helix (wHTH) protein/Tfp pilus assembly protein PilF
MSQAIKQLYRFGEFTVDADQKVLLFQDKPRPLTPKAFDTLLILVENSGRIVNKEELMKRLWPDTFVEEANLTTNILQLRKSLGDNARQPIYIETVARRGYRFIMPVETNGPSLSTAAGDTAADLHSIPISPAETTQSEVVRTQESGGAESPVRPASFRWPVVVGFVIVVIAILGGWLVWSGRSSRPKPSSTRVMMAVLPFQNLTGDAAQDYFSDGLTEEMITQLGNLDPEHLAVIARTSVMHYKDKQKPLDEIGRELQVQYVLEGSVRRESDRVRITAQLIQMKDQTHLWSREYDRETVHLLSLQDEIAKEVADEIHLTLGDHPRSAPAPRISSTNSYEAFDLYLKGEYYWNKRWVPEAVPYFQQAVAKDPNYARAYAGLANCYALIGGYSGRQQNESMPQARSAALRALELDGNLAEAHTALALIVQNYDYDWQTAEKEYRRAIELNPNYATAHHWYAEHLALLGRFDEALRESERARELDPLSLIIAVDNGQILYFSRQYDQAIQKFRAVQEMEPNFPRLHIVVFAYVEKGMYAEALADTKNWPQAGSSPWFWSELAYTYGRAGQQPEAQHALDKLLEMNRRQQAGPPALVWAYIGMGNKEQAFIWLEKAYSQHASLTNLKVDPIYDPLRGDPRFQDLLRRVGLAQ